MGKTACLIDDIYLVHETGPGHPEKPERLKVIRDRLKATRFFEQLIPVPPRKADYRHIGLIHDSDYINRAKKEIESGVPYLDSVDNTVCAESFEVAVYAAGGCLAMCDVVMSGAAQHGFCIIRPPGHHAGRNEAAGFCIFNNVAIAARYLQREYGIRRVAIVDWDVHHGNGTQESFENDDSVYYISLHQYPYYPGTGSPYDMGFGTGMGFTLNLPMKAGSGNSAYLQAFTDRVIPELDKYGPEVVLISAGFDAHRDDPLSSINLSTDMYFTFTMMLKEIARKHSGGRIIAVLEGGYNTAVCAEGVEKVLEALVEN